MNQTLKVPAELEAVQLCSLSQSCTPLHEVLSHLGLPRHLEDNIQLSLAVRQARVAAADIGDEVPMIIAYKTVQTLIKHAREAENLLLADMLQEEADETLTTLSGMFADISPEPEADD